MTTILIICYKKHTFTVTLCCRFEEDNFNNVETMFSLVQILAGTARKVTAVRFTRINGCCEILETKKVTRKAPKLIKRKWSNDNGLDGPK